MAAGTISVNPVGVEAGGPSLFKTIGEKVKKAKGQAIEARQEADERIEDIENIPEEERTQDDIVELDTLKEKRSQKGYFFKKALKFQATDKIKTTIGKFQRDPKLENDPAASEKERFYAKTGMFRPGEIPDMSSREDKNTDIIGYVGKGFQMIMDAIDKVKSKVNRTAESSEKTSRTASSTESTTESVSRSTENLSNSTENISNVSKSELNVQQSELSSEQLAEQRREQAAAEARSEAQSDTAGTTDVIETDQCGKGGQSGGLFSKILDVGSNLAGRRRFSALGRRGGGPAVPGRRRRAIANRLPGSGVARLARTKAGRAMSPTRRSRAYSAPIGPQPMNSSTPWAKGNFDENIDAMGNIPRLPSSTINLSQGGIISPIKPKKQQKLADGGITGLIDNFLPAPMNMMMNMIMNPTGMLGGGIGGMMGGAGKAAGSAVSSGVQMLTNPTKLVGDGLRAVLPMNRGVGKDVMKGDKGETENMSKIMQLMPLAGGGIMFAALAQVANAVPFLGAIIGAAKPIIKPLVEAFGLPASVLGLIFGGGAANAATMPFGGMQEDDPDPDPLDPPPGTTPPEAPLSGGSSAFGSISGNSGSVAINGKEKASVAVDYSPFSKSDIQKQRLSINSAKGFRRDTNSDHKGYDIPADQGTPLYAYLPGQITKNQVMSGYGNLVEWKDSVYNETHRFAHMMGLSPFGVGKSVRQGDMLGKVGSTGISSGPHLHWEIGPLGSQVDPGVWARAHPLPDQKPAVAATPVDKGNAGASPTAQLPTSRRVANAAANVAKTAITSNPVVNASAGIAAAAAKALSQPASKSPSPPLVATPIVSGGPGGTGYGGNN